MCDSVEEERETSSRVKDIFFFVFRFCNKSNILEIDNGLILVVLLFCPI